jgi:hypothetical protein
MMSSRPPKIGQRVMIYGGRFSGTGGVVRSIDRASATAVLAVSIFGTQSTLDVPLAHLSKKAADALKVKRFLRGRKGCLESYCARWHGHGFPQSKLEVRLDRFTDRYVLTGVVFDQDDGGDWQPWRTTSRGLTEDEWGEFRKRPIACSFWRLAKTDNKHYGLDGETWALEGVRDGRYHSVTRWSSGIGIFGGVCVRLAVLAGIWPYESAPDCLDK